MRKTTLALLALLALISGACSSDEPTATSGDDPRGTTVRVLSHDSFAVSDEVLEQFTDDTGIEVELVKGGDAGSALNQAVLTKGRPLADVFFGVDNTFLSRALDADIFEPYRAKRLDEVPARFRLDPEHRVTPVDHGDVCVNLDKEAFASTPAPENLADLANPRHRGQLVVQNPATSSPGLAFLLATIAEFGDKGWQAYWRQLVENDVEVVAGWEEAYNGSFSGGSGEGDRPLVVSYATSPPAEVFFADPQPTEAPTGVITDGCFGQVEFAGILEGTENRAGAEAFIDFLLSDTFQEDVPLQMFVFPVVDGVELPEVFVEHAARVEDPAKLAPATIGANRERWIREWTSIVLG